jgi:hypothetical protein
MRKSGLGMVVLLLAGCASPGIRPLRAFEVATAPYRQEVKESVVGSLMYEGGCLLFESEDHERRLPIWSTGTTFQESLITFHHPGRADERIVLGQEIRMDGASAEWPALPGYDRFEHQCGAKPFFVAGIAPAN